MYIFLSYFIRRIHEKYTTNVGGIFRHYEIIVHLYDAYIVLLIRRYNISIIAVLFFRVKKYFSN